MEYEIALGSFKGHDRQDIETDWLEVSIEATTGAMDAG